MTPNWHFPLDQEGEKHGGLRFNSNIYGHGFKLVTTLRRFRSSYLLVVDIESKKVLILSECDKQISPKIKEQNTGKRYNLSKVQVPHSWCVNCITFSCHVKEMF